MWNLFKPGSVLSVVLNKLADLIVLNILWFIASIPVLTMGPATVALYSCLEQRRKNNDSNLFKMFWNAYRSNFKQSIILMVVLLLIVSMLAFDIIFLIKTSFQFDAVVKIAISIIIVLVLLSICYVFPLQARFLNSIAGTLKNAWIMSILHFPKSIFIALLNYFPLICLLFFTEYFIRFLGLFLALGISCIAYINNIILQKIFHKYYDNK